MRLSAEPEPQHTAAPGGREHLVRLAKPLVFGVLLGGYVLHGLMVALFAVDVPFVDEWDMLDAQELPAGLTPDFLLRFHNEHRIVSTRLMIALLVRLNGWDLVVHQVVNFAVFGLLLGTLYVTARRLAPGLAGWTVAAFLLFALSPTNHQNHAWPFQVQFHFALLFFLLALQALFREAPSSRTLAFGVLAALLAAYSLAAGWVMSAILLAAFTALRVLRRGANAASLLAAVALAGGLALWFVGYVKPGNAPELSLPWQWPFWDYFLNLISWGFGVERVSWPLGLLGLAVLVVPMALRAVRDRAALSARDWAIAAGTLALLGGQASVAAGRAAFGVETAKASRFAEIGFLLIVFCAAAWSAALADRRTRHDRVLAALWLACFVAFLPHWRPDGYQRMRALKVRGVRCLQEWYRNPVGEPTCLSVYDLGPIGRARLEAARTLGLSFERRLREEAR